MQETCCKRIGWWWLLIVVGIIIFMLNTLGWWVTSISTAPAMPYLEGVARKLRWDYFSYVLIFTGAFLTAIRYISDAICCGSSCEEKELRGEQGPPRMQ